VVLVHEQHRGAQGREPELEGTPQPGGGGPAQGNDEERAPGHVQGRNQIVGKIEEVDEAQRRGIRRGGALEAKLRRQQQKHGGRNDDGQRKTPAERIQSRRP
jgi:hypothetical protein